MKGLTYLSPLLGQGILPPPQWCSPRFRLLITKLRLVQARQALFNSQRLEKGSSCSKGTPSSKEGRWGAFRGTRQVSLPSAWGEGGQWQEQPGMPVPGASACALWAPGRLSRPLLTPWVTARQAPPSLGLPGPGFRRGLPFPAPGGLPDPPRYWTCVSWSADSSFSLFSFSVEG